VKNVKNNCPGSDWAKEFLLRQPELSVRFEANIKSCLHLYSICYTVIDTSSINIKVLILIFLVS